MNIFENQSGILGGPTDPRSVERAFNALFNAARSVRAKLGENSYLADRYIESILKTFTAVDMPQVADDGFDGIGPLLRRCQELLEEMTCGKGVSPFSERASLYLPHLKKFRERRTRLMLLECAMFPTFCDEACAAYAERLNDAVDQECDQITTRGYYDDMAALLGGEAELEALNAAIKDTFLRITHMQVYFQAAGNAIADLLQECDEQTSKSIFTLLLDLPAASSEA